MEKNYLTEKPKLMAQNESMQEEIITVKLQVGNLMNIIQEHSPELFAMAGDMVGWNILLQRY